MVGSGKACGLEDERTCLSTDKRASLHRPVNGRKQKVARRIAEKETKEAMTIRSFVHWFLHVALTLLILMLSASIWRLNICLDDLEYTMGTQQVTLMHAMRIVRTLVPLAEVGIPYVKYLEFRTPGEPAPTVRKKRRARR